jgi:hypothetical protein
MQHVAGGTYSYRWAFKWLNNKYLFASQYPLCFYREIAGLNMKRYSVSSGNAELGVGGGGVKEEKERK